MTLLANAKVLAQQYRALTGKPLGITGEVAEYEASRILGVELTPARQAGYDAIETINGVGEAITDQGPLSAQGLQARSKARFYRCEEGFRRGASGAAR